MSRYPALAGVRIGCVQYLNSKPLIYGCDAPVTFAHPSVLAGDLAAGALDVALVPAFEALREPAYLAADGVAIASDGPVCSVFLSHRRPLAEIRTVALDPASLTSAHLLRVLLAEFHGLRPAIVPFPAADATLWIGNQALDFRAQHGDTVQYLDLGAEWQRCTGLPFVFALWLLRADLPHAAAIAGELRALKADGLAHLPEIIRAEPRDPILTHRYLTEHIRFTLGPTEKAGLEKFRELLIQHGFIPENEKALRFI